MVKDLLKSSSAGISPMEALGVSGSKILSEIISRPLIGDGTLMSGLIKSGVALGVGSFVKNKLVRVITTGMMVDGAEDIVRGSLGFAGIGNTGGAVQIGQSNQGSGTGDAI